jgi:hypothetical protein
MLIVAAIPLTEGGMTMNRPLMKREFSLMGPTEHISDLKKQTDCT